MYIGFFKKIKTLARVYASLLRIPRKYLFNSLLYPLDSTRYNEFAVFLEYLRVHRIRLRDAKILDVSSPFMMAYIFSRNNYVSKIDINENEARSIKKTDRLCFGKENATSLTFSENTFDFVYSISVVEHIYEGSMKALKEMVRVCKPGGFLYVSFPVSDHHMEEWIDSDIYSDQHKQGLKTFFQYRFSEEDADGLIKGLDGVEVIEKTVYWECKNGTYDIMTGRMRKRPNNKYLEFLKMAALNAWYGFTLLEAESQDFGKAKNLGNMSLLLKKKL